MLRKTFAIIFILTLMFGHFSGAVGSAKADQCTVEEGQLLIDAGQYKQAIHEFTCVIDTQPTEVVGYRGRIEAELLLGQYSNAVRDYARVTALVLPVHPDTENSIMAGYTARLTINPDNIPALTGESFAHWWFFEYSQAIHTLNHLLDIRPDSLYGNLFRGSSRLLAGAAKAKGIADLEYAITLAPQSADVHYLVSDAYTYGLPDPQRAFTEATLALNGGLNTPRIHAILASSYLAFGNQAAAATEIKTHIDLVTTELVPTSPMAADTVLTLDLRPGRTYEIPVVVTAGETLSILTSSRDFWDTILVLLAPDGTPVVGSDDYKAYFAGLDWTAGVTGTYRLQVTSFEGVSTGELVVIRK